MTFTVNQNLPDGWGGFYLSGRISDYWNRSRTEKQYQVSYNNSFGRLSWSASAQRVYTPDSSGHRRDDRISLNFSYPLWFGDNRTANLTSNTSFNNSRFASSQIGINGSLDSENNLNYGVSTTTATGGQHDVALNGSYRTPWTTLNGSYSQGEGYRQSGIGASGTMIAHSGGVVLSPESGSTMALIEAKDAARAMLRDRQAPVWTAMVTPSCRICARTGLTPWKSTRKAAMTTWPSIAPWRRLCRGKAAWLRSRSALRCRTTSPCRRARRTTSRCRLRQVFSPRRQGDRRCRPGQHDVYQRCERQTRDCEVERRAVFGGSGTANNKG